MDFPADFWLFQICFINVSLKFVTNFKFYKSCFINDYLRKHIYIIGWCPVAMEIHRL